MEKFDAHSGVSLQFVQSGHIWELIQWDSMCMCKYSTKTYITRKLAASEGQVYLWFICGS